MEMTQALSAFSALSQPTRLDVFRLLVRMGAQGLPAGEIADKLGVRQNTMSTNLSVLLAAGLIRNRREGRTVRYHADMEGMRGLLSFLMEDCCGGHPDLCQPVIEEIACPMGGSAMSDQEYNVLFLCTGNSARSLIAEAILLREGRGKFHAFSAGSQPRGEPHPFTLEVLQMMNHDTGFARSKSWEEFAADDAPEMDFVFTVCDNAAAETCPVWPGQPMSAHWGVPDPAAIDGTDAEKHFAFAETYRMLTNRISVFTSLPLASLDKLTLQTRLDEIGKTRGSAA